MEQMTREVATIFLRTEARKTNAAHRRLRSNEVTRFKFYKEDGFDLIYTQTINGVDRARVLVGFGSDNEPKILSSWFITPNISNTMTTYPDGVKAIKGERRLTTSHDSRARTIS